MKAREGFISIIALIVMSVVIIMTLYLGYTTKLEYLILNSTFNNTQSYYLSEGKILMAVSEDKYYLDQLYPSILDYFRTLPYPKELKSITIDREDLELGDEINNIKVTIVDKNDRKHLRMVAESNFRGLRTKVTSTITLINQLFEIRKSVLDINSIDAEYKDGLEELIQKISREISISSCSRSEDIYGMEFLNFNNIALYQRDESNFEISSFRETMTEPYIERFHKKEVFIVIKKLGENPIKFSIGNPDKSNEKIELSGIIYVEGNVIISSKFEFNGIIIAKDGEIIVDTVQKPSIKGLMIFDNITDNDIIEKADIIYSRHYIYKYGTYLPGFIHPIVDLIKSD